MYTCDSVKTVEETIDSHLLSSLDPEARQVLAPEAWPLSLLNLSWLCVISGKTSCKGLMLAGYLNLCWMDKKKKRMKTAQKFATDPATRGEEKCEKFYLRMQFYPITITFLNSTGVWCPLFFCVSSKTLQYKFIVLPSQRDLSPKGKAQRGKLS